jgi:hypothetical protein
MRALHCLVNSAWAVWCGLLHGSAALQGCMFLPNSARQNCWHDQKRNRAGARLALLSVERPSFVLWLLCAALQAALT